MDIQEKIARYQEIERRGLLDQLPPEKQAIWAEIKSRGLAGEQPKEQAPAQTDPYSALDKAKYGTRAAIEGALFGLGDIVAGATNAQIAPIAKTINAVYEGTPLKASDFNPIKNFKEGRREFVQEQKDFSNEHPFLDLSGNLVGGLSTGLVGGGKSLATALGKKGLSALAKEGAREGVKYGAAYGAGEGLTEDENKLSVANALKGGATGAVTGGVLGGVLPIATIGTGRGVQQFLGTKGYAQRAANEIFNEAGGKEIGQIVRNYKGTRALKEAIKADDNVALAVKEVADKEIINSARKTKELVNQTLGVADVEKELADARKLYDQVINQSNVRVPKEFYNKLGTQKALKTALTEDYNNELVGKGLDSLSVAQKTKEKLDEMISVDKKAGKDTRALNAARKEFVDKLDAIAPGYKQARETYSEVIRPYNVIKDFTKIEGRERTNSIKSLLTEENKEALTNAFGKEKADKFLKEMREQSVENERFNKLYNAAENKLTQETPKMQEGLAREAFESKGSTWGHALDMLRLGGATRGRRRIGEILLGMGEKEATRPNLSVSGILANKLKEKGGYAMKPLGQSGLDGEGVKAKQLSLIKKTNPMTDNYHHGIREIKDIKTFAEAVNDPESFVYPDFSKEQAQKALKEGKITIYSSKPIENGGFVSTSKRMAQDYAGSGKVYSKEVPLDNVAWLNADEGQYAKINAPKASEVLNSLGEPVAKTEEGVKNFNKWFKGSKVVDENGQPLVVYHGTNENFNAFDTSRIGSNTGNKGHYGTGFYATDKPEFAKQFGENIMPIYLKANKVFRGTPEQIKEVAKEMGVDAYERYAYAPKRLKTTIDLTTQEIYGDNPEPFTEALKKLGYDAVYDEGEYVVFNPNQIKSVKNSGKFDPKNPNIYKSIVGGLGISQILRNKEAK